ncbi:MAG: IS1634 family transposase [Desulfobacterales bacterium]|nr:IS1634 family transposase [Desulfobacterales bacterium]
MFIRKTTKSKNSKSYIQHQLVKSYRTPAGPRQKLILNLGFIDIPKEKWKELANAIEDVLLKQISLFEQDPEIEKLASHYASIIIQNRINNGPASPSDDKQQTKDYETIDVNTISTSDNKSIGIEHIVSSWIKKYKMDKILTELNFSSKELDYAKILIGARLAHPGSERETVRWINENSGLCELLGTDVKVYDNALHRTACLLMENHRRIETHLSNVSKKIFDLKEKIILYDLTNTYFEGTKKKSALSKPNRSKERRNDRPLVTLALTVDEDGFPKQSQIFEGNVSEPKTLGSILDELSKTTGVFNFNKTIVIDAGIAFEENIEIIKQKKFHYVAVSRKRSFDKGFWENATSKNVKLSDQKTALKIKYIKKDEEAWLLCHSPFKEAKEKSILGKKMEKFEAELIKIDTGLNRKRTIKKHDKVIERIGRLKERYGIGDLYNIEIIKKKDLAIEIKFTKNTKGKIRENKVGKYILRTNRLDLNGTEISKLHKSLTVVEDCFRSMKSHLGIRPIHHENDFSTMAHIFTCDLQVITVIAYHILAGILRTLKSNGINYNLETIRNILSTHSRVTTSFKTNDDSIVNIRTTNTPNIKQTEIYKALNLKLKPLGRIKIKTSVKEKAKSNDKKV